jgi:hypothetical protein
MAAHCPRTQGGGSGAALCRFLLFVTLVAVCTTAATTPKFPLPWLSPMYWNPAMSVAVASISRAEVLAPAHLKGNFAFAPAPWTGRMFINESCTGVMESEGSCRLTLRLSLLHPEDDNTLTYKLGSDCHMLHNENIVNETFTPLTLLLSQRRLGSGGCNFGQKAMAVSQNPNITVHGLMHTACNPAAPTFCSPDLGVTYANQVVNSVVMPYEHTTSNTRSKRRTNERKASSPLEFRSTLISVPLSCVALFRCSILVICPGRIGRSLRATCKVVTLR